MRERRVRLQRGVVSDRMLRLEQHVHDAVARRVRHGWLAVYAVRADRCLQQRSVRVMRIHLRDGLLYRQHVQHADIGHSVRSEWRVVRGVRSNRCRLVRQRWLRVRCGIAVPSRPAVCGWCMQVHRGVVRERML
jgi:hypothetical protein